MAKKGSVWTEKRSADFFLALRNEFGKYERRRWNARKCIEDQRGRPIASQEFDRKISVIRDRLEKRWKHDGLRVPALNGFLMVIEWITYDGLNSWEGIERQREIATEVGFISRLDLKWVQQHAKTSKKYKGAKVAVY